MVDAMKVHIMVNEISSMDETVHDIRELEERLQAETDPELDEVVKLLDDAADVLEACMVNRLLNFEAYMHKRFD